MKIFLIISAILGLSLFIFGYWGQHSGAGRIKFDEMAGMIPLGAYWLGIILILMSLCILLFKLFK